MVCLMLHMYNTLMYDHAKCTVRQRLDTKHKSLQTTVQRLYCYIGRDVRVCGL